MWLKDSILLIDETLTGTTTSSQSGPGSHGNKELLHIPQSSSAFLMAHLRLQIF